jgi:hypothetical protein
MNKQCHQHLLHFFEFGLLLEEPSLWSKNSKNNKQKEKSQSEKVGERRRVLYQKVSSSDHLSGKAGCCSF